MRRACVIALLPLLWICVLGVVCSCGQSIARGQSSTETADTLNPPKSAKELIADITRDESKLDYVHSFYLRMLGKGTQPPESIAARIEELRKRFPAAELTPEKRPELRPSMLEELEIAFDEHRLRKLDHYHDDYYALRVWDGRRMVLDQQYTVTGRKEYYLRSEPQGRLRNDLFSDLSWLHMGPHVIAGRKDETSPAELQRVYGLPEDYQFAGQINLRGRECLILENHQARRRLYVGIDDHRLHGFTTMFLLTALIEEKNADIDQRATGRTFASQSEFKQWLAGLSKDDKASYDKQMNEIVFDCARPLVENYLDDYREIAPGLWFPAKQGYTFYREHGKEVMVDGRRDLQMVQVKVNEPLDDSLFTIDLKDGVQVFDGTHEPPLVYTQKANRTEEEWQAIFDEAAHNKQD